MVLERCIWRIAWCEKKENGISPDYYNSIINKTPLSGPTNKFVSGDAPSKYLERIVNKRNISKEQLCDIFNGVSAKVLLNPNLPSVGGRNRAKNVIKEDDLTFCEAAVNDILGTYSIILDNHSVPLSWARELKVVGSLFFDLEKQQKEVDIQSLCNRFAQSRTDRNELKKLIKKSPYFPPRTWQEKAIELLCGDNNENDEENE